MGGRARDVSKEKFGKLKPIRCVGKHASKSGKIDAGMWWECKCDCGRLHVVRLINLTCKPGTRSCGCDNPSSVRMLTINGKTMNITQWANENGLTKGMVSERIRRGMTDIEAVTTPRMRPGRKRRSNET